MFKMFVCVLTICSLSSFSLFSDCCQSVEFTVGWRGDHFDWKRHDLKSSYVPGCVNSRIHFKDLNSYTINTKAKWVDTDYYVRFSADYGWSYKGRAKERFRMNSCWLYYPICVETDNPIKRCSEVYDFNIAAGYPFAFFNCRLNVIPLIGFSFHRQHLRVKEDKHSTCSCCYDSCYSDSSHRCYSSDSSSCCCSDGSSCCCCPSSSHFSVSSSNPFVFSTSSDPFASPSESGIASALGLSKPHRTSNYRFTWFGFYLGTDIAFALDSCWTLYSELEFHFFDNCHRKVKSWTGVYFVDDYHERSWSYGFNSVLGLTYAFTTCWYSTVAVDFNWWKACSHDDDLYWKMSGIRIGLGYMF